MQGLGDSHNFGQFVRVEGKWVRKPRPLFWEWLFLSQESFLRQETKKKAIKNNEIDPFEYHPNLRVVFEEVSRLESSGKIEFCKLLSPVEFKKVDLAQGFGRCLANSYFWGVSDLHFENIAYSASESRKDPFIFPVDIETAFFNQSLLSQTSMLRSTENNYETVGSKYIENLGLNVAEIIKVFLETIQYYQKYRYDFHTLLKQKNLIKYPIRCVLKPTYIYMEYLKGGKSDEQFFSEELVQLSRGDVPYFYTYLDSDMIFYLGKDSPLALDKSWESAFGQRKIKPPKLDNILTVKRADETLFSSLQIARTFDSDVDEKHFYDEVIIEYRSDQIFLSTEQSKIRCRRLKRSS